MMLDNLLEYLSAQSTVFIGLIVLFGLLVGSFLNVVIYRLPLIMKSQWYHNISEILLDALKNGDKTGIPLIDIGCKSCSNKCNEDDLVLETEVKSYSYLAWPPSSCPNCNHKIHSFQNIPLLSWFLLRGKCAECKTPISIQYPLIELLTGVLSGCVAWKFGATQLTFFYLLLIWALIAATFIDFKHYLLPDEITLPFIWLGIILAAFKIIPITIDSSVWGAVVGYLFFWSIFWLFKILFKKDGMGYGDFKLLSMLGAWFGWTSIFPIVLLSTICGSVIGVSLILFNKHAKEKPIPFGPYLALAGIIYLFFGGYIQSVLPF